MRRLTLRTIGASLGIALAASAPAQDIEIKGAQIALHPKEETFTQITIENRRKSPLVVWQIALSAPASAG